MFQNKLHYYTIGWIMLMSACALSLPIAIVRLTCCTSVTEASTWKFPTSSGIAPVYLDR